MNSKDIIQLSQLLGTSQARARRQLYFLRLKYGKRLGVKRLVRIAVTQIVAGQARFELEQAESELQNGE